jgi:hypothetical protein
MRREQSGIDSALAVVVSSFLGVLGFATWRRRRKRLQSHWIF